MRTDIELLEAWRLGDTRCGREFVRRHFATLHRFFCNKLGDEIDDLIQQTFASFLQCTADIRNTASVRNYLLRIARSRLYDHLRSKVRERIEFVPDLVSVAALGTSPSSELARTEAHERLLRTLQQLPIDLQVTLELHYWQGLTNEEIAEVLEIPTGTVKSRIRRAKEAVRERMRSPAGHARADSALMIDCWAQEIDGELERLTSTTDRP